MLCLFCLEGMNILMKRNERKIRLLPEKTGWRDLLLVPFGALVTLALLESFGRGGLLPFLTWVGAQPLMALANYAVFLAVLLIFSFFPNNRLRAALMWLLWFAAAVIGMVNQYKILYRFEPVLFSDVTLIGGAIEIARGGLSFSIKWAEIAIVLVALVLVLPMLLWVMKKEKKAWAILPPVIGIVLLAVLLPAFTYGHSAGGKETDLVTQFKMDGTVYTAVEQARYSSDMKRSTHSEQEVRQAYRTIAEAVPETKKGEKPNIIFVLYESFCDESWLGNYVDLTRELMPFYNQLVKNCRTGRIYVPKTGGGTSETEFEVLTGISSRYSYNPYSVGLPVTSSLASVLGDQGYHTAAIHWFKGVYYNRYRNLGMEGFQNFFTTDTTWGPYQRIGTYIADNEHFNAALQKLKETEERDFLFLMTMQNHGGYDYEDWRIMLGADEPFTGDYSDHTRLVLSNYCYLLQQSDRELETFITELASLEEPTYVVFFGDHLPPLGTDTYEELGIPLHGSASHITPYFIWTNAEKENSFETADMYAWELGAYVLDVTGLNRDPFLNYVNELRKNTAAEELTEAGRHDPVYDMLCMDVLFGNQYSYQEGNIHPEKYDMKIGGDMTVLGYDTLERDGKLYVKPVFANAKDCRYTLYVNGTVSCDSSIPIVEGEIELQCRLLSDTGALYNTSQAIVYRSI